LDLEKKVKRKKNVGKVEIGLKKKELKLRKKRRCWKKEEKK